jgi:predicted site-specific integrase-resolvase
VQGVAALGLVVAQVVSGVGSGVCGRRRELHGVLSDPAVSVLVVSLPVIQAYRFALDPTRVRSACCSGMPERRASPITGGWRE